MKSKEKKPVSITKKHRIRYLILAVLSLCLGYGPLIGWAIYGYIIAGNIGRMVLTATIVTSIALGIFDKLTQRNARGAITIVMLLGIYFSVKDITIFLYILALFALVDATLISPLKNSEKSKFEANKALDGRIKEENKNERKNN